MQFLIDTATDSPTELYKIGRFLVGQFETSLGDVKVGDSITGPGIPDGSRIAAIYPAETLAAPLPPAAPLDLAAIVSDDDVEVEIDDEGNIASVAAVVTLPAAPPPPAAPPGVGSHHVPAAVPQPPGPAVAAELDSRGLPWDGRIHASNRAQSIKKEWKLKRGVDKNLVAAVEAQNKPGNAPTAAPAAVATAIPAATAPALSTAMSAPPPPLPPAPAVPSAALPSAPPVTAPAPSGVVDFRGLMQKITAATAAGKLSTDQVVAALAGVGLKPEEMTQLIGNAPLIASINAAIDGYLA